MLILGLIIRKAKIHFFCLWVRGLKGYMVKGLHGYRVMGCNAGANNYSLYDDYRINVTLPVTVFALSWRDLYWTFTTEPPSFAFAPSQPKVGSSVRNTKVPQRL